MRTFFSLFPALCLWIIPAALAAQSVPSAASQATVWVGCDDRQGSGTVTEPNKGYVLTAGHVALDYHTGTYAKECLVAFADPSSGEPRYYFRATIIKAVYFDRLNQDFAVLQIQAPIGQIGVTKPFPYLKTFEFAEKGDAVSVVGFSGDQDKRLVRSGHILDLHNGFVDTDAEILPGDSGGTLATADDYLIGIPTRIVTLSPSNGPLEIRYEHVDIRSVINWLDTVDVNGHDEFIIHADPLRYHEGISFVEQTDLDCFDLVRSVNSSSVYCLMTNNERLPFPNDLTFHSWFPNFDDVHFVDDSYIQEFELRRNVTYRPGTLIKIATTPEVYVVVDAFGTIRHIANEQRAIDIWGENWAGLVHDVPDVFFANYTIGQPIQ